MNRKLQLDFQKVSSLFLAYPEGVLDCGTDYTPATPVFDELIKSLSRKLNLVVMVKTAEQRKKVEGLRRKNTITLINNELSSIWLRDTAGFNMGTHIVKPIFKPKYYRKYYDEANNISQYMKVIHSILGVDMEKIPLIWDGGNLVTNGEVGFITEQIIHDNKKTHTEEKIKEIIKSHLDIEPIFLPVLPEDVFGHSDGYLAFLNTDTIAISVYPRNWKKKDRDYLQTIKTIVKRHISKVVEIKENLTGGVDEGISSAKGNYVNFLQLGKEIYMPSFGDGEIEKWNKDVLSKYGKVRMINCNELAQFGGLLHCISFTN